MKYVILNQSGHRVRDHGILTPCFDYSVQAYKYILKHLGNSPGFKVHRVNKKN